MQLTLKRSLNIFILVGLIITFLILAKKIIIPLVFAIMFSILFLPFVNKIEKRGISKNLAISITILIILFAITLFSFTMSTFMIDIYEDLPKVGERLSKGLDIIINEVSKLIDVSDQKIKEKIKKNLSSIISQAFSITSNGIKVSILAIGNSLLVILYTFLLLSYRKGIKKILFRNKEGKSAVRRKNLIEGTKKIVSGYFSGMLMIMLILATLNSFSLWIIGVDYPLFWGVLAGSLVIVPYIGTILGGVFPLFYSLATTDTFWQPIAIIIVYVVVQQIEGNFITPKILGSQIDFNMLTIIIALFFGALIWGIPGIIIAVPTVGILQNVFMNYDELKPIGELMSSDLSK